MGQLSLPLLESMNLRSRSMSWPMIEVLASGEGKKRENGGKRKWERWNVGIPECTPDPAEVIDSAINLVRGATIKQSGRLGQTASSSPDECPPAAAEWRAQHPPNGSSVPRSSPSSTASSPARAALFFFLFSSSCLILILLSTARTQLASLYLHSAVWSHTYHPLLAYHYT
jgi:hypothetical protein